MIDKAVAFFAFLGFLGMASIVLFAYLGSHVDIDGTLHEPFALLPIGHGLVWLGLGGIILLLAFRALLRFVRARKLRQGLKMAGPCLTIGNLPNYR